MRRALVVCAILAMACGEDDDDVEEACLDVADAAGDMAARCFPDDPNAYDAMHEGIVDGVGGDCGNVKAIRDMDELREECIPWMQDVACSIVTDEGFQLDSSCEDQLLI